MLAHRAGVVSGCRNWVGALRRARSLALGLRATPRALSRSTQLGLQMPHEVGQLTIMKSGDFSHSPSVAHDPQCSLRSAQCTLHNPQLTGQRRLT